MCVCVYSSCKSCYIMYISTCITEAASLAQDAPSRTRLQLADLLDLPGGASNLKGFATITGQSMCNPNHLFGSSPLQYANACNSGIPPKIQEDAADATRGFAQCGQPTCDNGVPRLGQSRRCGVQSEQYHSAVATLAGPTNRNTTRRP